MTEMNEMNELVKAINNLWKKWIFGQRCDYGTPVCPRCKKRMMHDRPLDKSKKRSEGMQWG
jgi:hypothetical protein